MVKSRRTAKVPGKPAESSARANVLETSFAGHGTSGGLLVTGGASALLILDAAAKVHTLEPGESCNFLPASVAGVKAGLEDSAAFRPAAPSSALWLEIRNPGKAAATVSLDPSGLRRDAARWGRPAVLVFSAEEHGTWQIAEGRGEFPIPPGSRLLVIAIGHGLAVDPATVFSALLTSAASHRAEALKERSKDGK